MKFVLNSIQNKIKSSPESLNFYFNRKQLKQFDSKFFLFKKPPPPPPISEFKFKQYFIMNNHNEDWAAGNLPI